MPIDVMSGEIDRDNNPVGVATKLGSFEDRAAAQRFIEGEIARFDHNGFVPDGPQAGWWGRNDRDHAEKFHFWIDDTALDVIGDPQSRGLP